MHRRTLLAVSLLSLTAPRAEAAPVSVAHVWSRAAMAGHTGVVYLTITATDTGDTLLGASSPVAPTAELHESVDDHGVMKMRPIAALPVAPGQTVMLKPGGYHIMLIGLTKALTNGETFPITLRFAKAGDVTVMATVAPAGASEMPMKSGSMPGMKM